MTSITIPTSVSKIGQSAFRDCYNLISIIIPTSVTKINYDSFNYYNLKYLKISKYLYNEYNLENCLNSKCELEFWKDKSENEFEKEYINLKNKLKILLQAYKNVSQKYSFLFKEFEDEILKLKPIFKFE